jgi:hypothetical protein
MAEIIKHIATMCCSTINFYTYPMDTNKVFFKFWTKKDMYSPKNSILL